MAKTNRFSDIDLDFTRNPISGDVNILTDDVAIKRAVRNLILSEKFDRLMQPEVECRISDSLFENMTPLTEVRIETAIRNTLTNHEPRIEIIDVIVEGNNDKNYVNVTVIVRIRNTSDNITVPIKLERTR